MLDVLNLLQASAGAWSGMLKHVVGGNAAWQPRPTNPAGPHKHIQDKFI